MRPEKWQQIFKYLIAVLVIGLATQIGISLNQKPLGSRLVAAWVDNPKNLREAKGHAREIVEAEVIKIEAADDLVIKMRTDLAAHSAGCGTCGGDGLTEAQCHLCVMPPIKRPLATINVSKGVRLPGAKTKGNAKFTTFLGDPCLGSHRELAPCPDCPKAIKPIVDAE